MKKLSFSARLLLCINALFPKRQHPFNMQNAGNKTYAEWQFEKGYDTIELFCGGFTTDEMFKGKKVLDMGCGAAGKSLYYVTLGAEKVTGAEIVSHHKAEAEALACAKGLSDRFEFVLGSALQLPFPDKSFDTIIMNDFMEHISDPEAALKEAMRLLDDKGRIYINFSPYYHPFGAHLWDAIYIPWVHSLFSEKTMIEAYKYKIKDLPDRLERESLRITKDENGNESLGYLNKMTIKRYYSILDKMGIKPVYLKEVPLRSIFTPLAKTKLFKEQFVKMVVTVIEK